MLRRGYSYYADLRPDDAPDADLLLVAWQADPTIGFTQVQRKGNADGPTRFLRHGAISTVPGGYVGQSLLKA